MMHEDIIAVASSLFARASFWPISGSSVSGPYVPRRYGVDERV